MYPLQEVIKVGIKVRFAHAAVREKEIVKTYIFYTKEWSSHVFEHIERNIQLLFFFFFLGKRITVNY